MPPSVSGQCALILLMGTRVSVLDPTIPVGVAPGAAGFAAGLGASAGF